MIIVAYPDTLRTFDTVEEACAFGETIRDERAVQVFEIREVARLFPRGKPGPEPKPPGTPTEAQAQAKR